MTTHQPWDVLSTTELLDRQPWLRVIAEHVRLPNGVEIPDFYRIEMLEFVKVCAVCEDGRVPMVQHYKNGPRMVSTELPAGYIDAGETPGDAARRELREETGIEARTWRYLGRYFLDGNRGCGAAHVFLALDARVVAEPQYEDSELITLRWFDLDALRAAWLAGEFKNVATVAAVGLALGVLAQIEQQGG